MNLLLFSLGNILLRKYNYQNSTRIERNVSDRQLARNKPPSPSLETPEKGVAGEIQTSYVVNIQQRENLSFYWLRFFRPKSYDLVPIELGLVQRLCLSRPDLKGEVVVEGDRVALKTGPQEGEEEDGEFQDLAVTKLDSDGKFPSSPEVAGRNVWNGRIESLYHRLLLQERHEDNKPIAEFSPTSSSNAHTLR